MLGLFQELGPCRIDDSTSINGTSKNPYSWNSNANIIFLDEPLGVGLSYSRHGQKVGTTEEAALDVQAFLSLFFQTFKSFAKNDFYMAGESYGGRYLPVFAGTALDMNARNVKRGLPEINLRGVLIGNGVTSAFQTMESYYTYQCTSIPGIGKPLQSVGTCVQMRKALPYCMEMVQSECLRRHDSIGCTGAMSFCEAALGEPFGRLDLNP
jgi:cathepsin A (carboxypeptidase C)